MKKLLVVFLIAGILVRVQSLKCHQCIDATYDTDDEDLRKSLETMDAGLARCDTAESTECEDGLDSCAANILSYKITHEGKKVPIRYLTRACSRSDMSWVCEMFEKTEFFDDQATCKTETCSTDGCNAATFNEENEQIYTNFIGL
jgi:hypothetical protein